MGAIRRTINPERSELPHLDLTATTLPNIPVHLQRPQHILGRLPAYSVPCPRYATPPLISVHQHSGQPSSSISSSASPLFAILPHRDSTSFVSSSRRIVPLHHNSDNNPNPPPSSYFSRGYAHPSEVSSPPNPDARSTGGVPPPSQRTVQSFD